MFSHKIIPEKKLIIMYRSGTASYEKYINSYESLRDDPLYKPDYNVVIDSRQLTIPPELAQAEDLPVRFIEILSPTGKWIHLVDTSMETALVKKFSTLANKHSDHFHIKLVDTVKAAGNYIGTNLSEYLDDRDTYSVT